MINIILKFDIKCSILSVIREINSQTYNLAQSGGLHQIRDRNSIRFSKKKYDYILIQGEWAYTARSGGSNGIGSCNAITTITISSGRRIQLYTPMQESKRAQRLKNIPYELQYFQTSLPTKSFKSSHLMNDELLKKPKEQIDNQQRWQLHSHFNKMNLALTQYQIKRFERSLKKTESSDDVNMIKKQNEENIEKEKQKRNTQYKKATQNLIHSFTKKFNIKALYNDLQTNQQ